MTTDNFDPYNLDEIDRLQRIEDGEIDDDGTDGGNADGVGGGDGAGDGGTGGEDTGTGDGTGDGTTSADAGNGTGDGGAVADDLADDGTGAGDGGNAPKPIGVSSKNGERVLPYSALQEARRKAQRAELREAALKARIAELEAGGGSSTTKKGGTTTGTEIDELTDEELAEIEADFPQLAKAARAVRNAASNAPPKTAPQSQGQPSVDDIEAPDPIQDAIDANPELLKWQTDKQHAGKFQMAVQVDNLLKASPKWANKPLEERFAEAVRRVKQELDDVSSSPSRDNEGQRGQAQQRQTSSRDKARQAAAGAQRRGPQTLSDLKGSVAPASDNVAALAPVAMLNKFEAMSTEEILAHLDRGG